MPPGDATALRERVVSSARRVIGLPEVGVEHGPDPEVSWQRLDRLAVVSCRAQYVRKRSDANRVMRSRQLSVYTACVSAVGVAAIVQALTQVSEVPHPLQWLLFSAQVIAMGRFAVPRRVG